MAPPASRVPALMQDLFHWLKTTDDHLLIRSCVFHYEFEFIHPFADGNGRMGRLWQSLILGKFLPVFQHLPVETMVHDAQQAYYEALNRSTQNADCGAFIDYMLGKILRALKTSVTQPASRTGKTSGKTSGVVNGVVSGVVNEVLAYIRAHEGSRANAIASALAIPPRTVQRHLAVLKRNGEITFKDAPKTGGYWCR